MKFIAWCNDFMSVTVTVLDTTTQQNMINKLEIDFIRTYV